MGNDGRMSRRGEETALSTLWTIHRNRVHCIDTLAAVAIRDSGMFSRMSDVQTKVHVCQFLTAMAMSAY